MKKRIVSVILCAVMCCTLFPAAALAVGSEPQQGGYYQGDESPAMVAVGKILDEILPEPIPGRNDDACEDNLSFLNEMPAMASVRYYSNTYLGGAQGEPYSNSLFMDAFQNFTSSDRANILLVVASQVGYHEGDHAMDLSGTSNGTGNYTEYGWWSGDKWLPWGIYFLNWSAAQAECGFDFYSVSASPYNSSAIQKGDIVYLRNGENIGIVMDITTSSVVFVEANYSDKVTLRTLPKNSTEFTSYYAPPYQVGTGWVQILNRWYYYDPVTLQARTGWFAEGGNWYYLDPNNRGMLTTGTWEIDGVTYEFDESGVCTSHPNGPVY